jgi:hypothetical protein
MYLQYNNDMLIKYFLKKEILYQFHPYKFNNEDILEGNHLLQLTQKDKKYT